jgi:hypothetical protein
MRVCVSVVINMHSHTCAFIAVVLKIDRCTCTYILWKYSIHGLHTREERKVVSWREVPSYLSIVKFILRTDIKFGGC